MNWNSRAFSLGLLLSCFAANSAYANTYSKTYNQYMGVASTGENVTLLNVRTEIRGGYGSWVKYKIGGEVVDTGIVCPSEYTPRGYFTDQGTRYAQSAATKKILSIACAYERSIINSR